MCSSDLQLKRPGQVFCGRFLGPVDCCCVVGPTMYNGGMKTTKKEVVTDPAVDQAWRESFAKKTIDADGSTFTFAWHWYSDIELIRNGVSAGRFRSSSTSPALLLKAARKRGLA